MPRVSKPQEQGQECVRFSPRIAGNYIIKGAREARVHWEREMVQRITDGRQADLRTQTLKRSGTGQEVDIKMSQQNSRESRVAVGGVHIQCIDKGCMVSQSLKTM